ncbi:hypothetical protein [Mesorhizobium sp. SP-1A]|uniref:hypothetical protein n=1 Tax=Mesorhizobium sp. SP-1A TaxID=3077840 RepID=UPI0028F6F791|nr:hypothetical protein [Mesorhizobium sp. SP-1A]
MTFAKVLETQEFMTAPFANHGTLSPAIAEGKRARALNRPRLRRQCGFSNGLDRFSLPDGPEPDDRAPWLLRSRRLQGESPPLHVCGVHTLTARKNAARFPVLLPCSANESVV